MDLFDPLALRGIRLRNRIAVSPLCEYSAVDGVPQPWHLVHLGSRAVGGAGLVLTEATAVEAAGRISPGDTGIWDDTQAEAWAPIARFIAEQGAIPGMQLAHAGRKASVDLPWRGGRPLAADAGGWSPILAPSALPFDGHSATPLALTVQDIATLVEKFAQAATRALQAGFQLLEVHAAHGYLIHEFLSPLSNRREDGYGGSFENRTRLLREVVSAVQRVWPDHLPLLVRISASDWAEGGWDLEQSVALAQALKGLGVDLVDCSSGGNVAGVKIPVGPGYQVPFAARIRREAAIATGAVGLITTPEQAQAILAAGDADLILLARAMLRDPYWPQAAALALGRTVERPVQYQRA